MKKMTIRQKLLVLIVTLVVIVIFLSLFFISRLGAIGKIYQNVSNITVPQHKITSAMTLALLQAKLNLNDLVQVERDIEKYNFLKNIIQAKLNEYQLLEKALLNGHDNLGKEIKGLEGLKVLPCERGGEIENLTKNASVIFVAFKSLCIQIMDQKGEELELIQSIGWSDKQEGSTGVVKTLEESMSRLASAEDDIEFQAMVFDIKRYQDKIIRDPNKTDMDELKMVFENLNFVSGVQGKKAASDYFAVYESIANKLLRIVNLKSSIDQLNNKELADKHTLLDRTLVSLITTTHSEMIKNSSDAIVMERTVSWLATIACIIVIGVSIVFGWAVSTSINKKLNQFIHNLTESEEHLAAACTQVSSASQAVAQGASEQAASIEETSSSMEEMASMTKMNADHAKEADALMKNVAQVMEGVEKSSVDVADSMIKISRASEETSKIVKTIDEIAFQTNLLALNAAVEAARAGEAGASFAVVANEVRNLAGRAANAAKSTSDLIEGIVKQIKEGSDIVTKTGVLFKDLVLSVLQGGELVAEIAVASHEQSDGINQVNKAIGDMDNVAQQNAANAEESASAAEEMNREAEKLRTMIKELKVITGGEKTGFQGRIGFALPQADKSDHKAMFSKVQKKLSKNRHAIPSKELFPDSLIPLDEKSFDEF